MEQNALSLKGVFRDLASVSWPLNYFPSKGKEYEIIAKYIIDIGDAHPLSKINDVHIAMGISYSRFKPLLLNL
jgi:hypothetical protein